MRLAMLPLSSWGGVLSRYEMTPPLHYLLLKALLRILGPGELAARLPSALAGTATVASLILWLRSEGRPCAGLLAALVLALDPYHVAYSQEGRAYALMGLWLVLSMWSLRKALRSDSRSAWWAYGASCVAMLYTHNYGILVVSTQFLYLLLRRRLPWAAAGVLLLYAPWLPMLWSQAHSGAYGSYILPAFRKFWPIFAGYTGSEFVIGETGFGGLPWLRLPAAVVFMAALARLRLRRLEGFLFWNLASCTILPYLISLRHPIMLSSRHPVIALPAFAALAGLGARRLPRPLRCGWIAAWISISGMMLYPLYAVMTKSQDREAARYLQRVLRTGDKVLFVPEYMSQAAEFYAPMPVLGTDGQVPSGRAALVYSRFTEPASVEAARERLRGLGLAPSGGVKIGFKRVEFFKRT